MLGISQLLDVLLLRTMHSMLLHLNILEWFEFLLRSELDPRQNIRNQNPEQKKTSHVSSASAQLITQGELWPEAFVYANIRVN